MKERNPGRKLDDAFTALLSFIADPVIVLDDAGSVLATNQVVENTIGIKTADIIGKDFFEQNVFDEKQTLFIRENMRQRLSGVNIEPYEVTLNDKNGKSILLEVNAKKVEYAGQVLDFVVFRDVTERTQRQRILQRDLCNSELRFKTISDSTFDSIVLFDSKEKIRYWNPAAEKMFGYEKTEVLGKTLRETIVPSHAFPQLDKIREEFSKNLEETKGVIELLGLKKDGTEFPVEISISSLQVGEERLAVIMFRDITERKNAEYAWKQQHEMLETVTDNTGVGLMLINRDYQVFWTNNPMKQLFGGDIQSKTCYAQLHNQSSICPDCGVKKVFSGEGLATREVSGVDKEGHHFSLQLTVTPVKDKHGQICAALEVAVPTTHRKQMETKIREAESLYHAMFEQTPLGVLVIDPETATVLQFNDIAHRQLGYTREEFSKLKISDFEAIDTPQEIKDRLNKALRERQLEFLTKHRTKNGETRTVLINQRKIELSGKEVLLTTSHDVTGINRMHEALRCSEERFYGIANSVKDALILVDEEAKVTYWNPAAEKIFGYTSKEAIGKKVHDLVVPNSLCEEGKERIKASVKTFGETGIGYFTVGEVEVVGCRKDGSEFPAELALSPIKSCGKWNAVGVIKDITKRKQADQKLRDAEQRYHTLFNQAPLGVLVVDPATAKCVEFNDTAHLQLGYTREEFEKIQIFDIEANEIPEETKAHLKEMAKTGIGEFETRHKTKSGENRNVIVTSRAFQLEGKTFLNAIFHDVTDNKKIHDALIESESRYRQLVEVAQEGIWAIDNDFTTTFVNPRITQMLGYEEAEIVGRQLFDFIGADMVEKIRGVLKGFNKPDMRGLYEYAFPRKGGGHVDTSVALSVITDDQKRKTGILAVVSDITQRKRAEEALKESEERFRAISTSAMDAIVLSDADDRVLYWNPAAEKTFGYVADEARYRKLTELVIPPETHKKYIQMVEELTKAPQSKRYSGLTGLRKDGTSFPMDLSIATVNLKDQTCLLAIIKDITEWKAMEERLKQERDLLDSVAVSTDAIIAIINPDYRIVWANPKSKQTTGIEEIENRYCYQTFGSGSKEVCQGCGVREVLEKGAGIYKRDYYMKVGKEDRWSELIATPIKDKDGKVIAALEVAIDITERKRLQNKLAEYSQRLEEIVQKRTEELKKTQAVLVKSERLAAIGELAGMIGHDLRNPLTGIKNSAYFMKKKGEEITASQAREMLETIDKCVDYSNRIVNDLLDYSREIHLTTEEESPRKILNDSLELIDIPHKISVINKIEVASVLKLDSDKIKRVFINLIRNAVDAMPNGGEITVTSQEQNKCLQISFSDTGMGISEEILPKLFQPLFTTKAQGMGFGLAICKRIVEAHGGIIAVKTVKGQGTTFTITLPINPKLESGGENVWINIPESSLSMTMKP